MGSIALSFFFFWGLSTVKRTLEQKFGYWCNDDMKVSVMYSFVYAVFYVHVYFACGYLDICVAFYSPALVQVVFNRDHCP